MINIAFYGSHNASFAIEVDGKITLVQEVERLLNFKNSGVAQYKTVRSDSIDVIVNFLKDYLLDFSEVKEFDNCYYLNTDVIIGEERIQLEKIIPAKNYYHCLHHRSHAAGSFYQSPFPEALIFSFDGGGNDGFFNIYHATRSNSVELLEKVLNPEFNQEHVYYDLGFPYMVFGQYLKDIKYEVLSEGNLVYPGKIMGLASYGKVREEWIQHIEAFYKSNPDGETYETGIEKLGIELNLKFDLENRFEEQEAYDLAATSQKVFEECFLEIATPYINKFEDLPVILTGGCALNIILNTRIKEELKKEVFVGPNPNDCGLAVGMLLDKIRPEKPLDLTYSGSNLLDYWNLGNYIQNFDKAVDVSFLNFFDLCEDLQSGKIVGVARGRSEHGPRALGNRSILCNPAIKEMKDILNSKVKNREWYRPFAPVVRLEDVEEYFIWTGESRWMSFCPKVREEWRDHLPSITHVDGTARIQTVTRSQNTWLYDLITEFKKVTGIGVLLNTSFNVNGRPILSTVQDAFKIFDESEMDCLLIEETYICKK